MKPSSFRFAELKRCLIDQLLVETAGGPGGQYCDHTLLFQPIITDDFRASANSSGAS